MIDRFFKAGEEFSGKIQEKPDCLYNLDARMNELVNFSGTRLDYYGYGFLQRNWERVKSWFGQATYQKLLREYARTARNEYFYGKG